MPFGTNDKVYVEPFGKGDTVHPDSQGQYQQMYGVIPGQEGEEERVRQLKAQRAQEPLGAKIARVGTGVGEAALSTATGLLAPFQAIPAAALKSALGMVPDAEQEAARLMAEKTYQPRGETGQDYAETIGKGFNELMALGPGNLSGLARPRPGALTKRAPIVGEVPKPVETPAKPWDKMNTQERIDALKVEDTGIKTGWDESTHVKTKAEALADEATVARLEAAIAKQNPEQPVIRVGKDGEAYPATFENEVARKAAEQRMLSENERIFQEQQQQNLLDMPKKAIQEELPFTSSVEEIAGKQADPRQPDMFLGNEMSPALEIANPLRNETSVPKGTTAYGDVLPQAGKEFPKENIQVIEKSTLDSAVDKIASGRKFDMTAEERIVWDKAQANLVDAEGKALQSITSSQWGGPRGQRGSSQLLTDVAHGIVNAVRSVKNGVHTTADYIAKLPGLSKEADALITKPTAAKDLLEKARSEGDGPKLWNNWQSGLSLAKDKLQSTMVSNIAEWFNWSNSRGNYIVRQAVYPLEKTFAKLGTKNLVDLLSIVHSEMMQRHEFSKEQLSRITNNPKILEARDTFRKVWKVLLDEQNAQRDREGKPRITEMEAYMSSIFRGDYHVPLYAKSGKLIGYFQTNTKGGAKNAIAWIKEHYKDHPDVDVSSLKYNHEKMYQPGGKFGNAPRDVLSSWKDIADALGDSPLSAEFKQAMEQWVAQKGTHAFAQDLHHVENKANVRGFEGDQPWLGANKNAHNWAKAQIQNMQEAVRWSTAQEAISHAKEFLTDPVIQENQTNNVGLAKAYMYDHMGSSQNLFRQVENTIAGAAGISRSTIKATTDLLRAGIYFKTLFGSAPYMIATPVQAIWGSSMWFHRELLEGNVKVKPVQFMGDLMDSMLGSTIPGSKINIPKISKESNAKLKWAEDNGYIHNILHEEGASIGAHKSVDMAADFSNKVIAAPDNWVRRVIFLPFANALEASGKYATKEAAWRRAGEITDNIAVSMRQQDKPLFIKKMGILGDLSYIFHAPVANMYNNLAAMNKYRKQTGNWGPLVNGLGMMALVGGVTNLPGAKESLAGIDMLKNLVAEYLPEHYNSFDPRVALLKLLPETKVLGHTFGENVSSGIASTATGMDLRSRLSNEVIDAEQPLKSILPGTGVYGDMLKSAWKTAVNPTEYTGTQLAKDLTPGPTLRGMMETQLPQFKTQSQPGADKGITSYRNPNNLDDPSAFVRRTKEETQYKSLGVTALTEGIRREKDARWNAEMKRQTIAKGGIEDKIFKDIANARIDDKTLANNIAKYVELSGDTKALQRNLETRLADMNFTKMENATNKMKGYTKVMGVLQRLNMDQPVVQ